ncbi:MAG: F0F1 ATP synthase subunit A [Clostridia bacterium]|nr:F0F1 ATP synthase subunit A [Clostridia bacterium]
MSKKQRIISVAIFATLIILILSGIFLIKTPINNADEISEVMRDAVLHEREKISIFGISVNPGLVSAYTVTAILLLLALIIRIFAIPKFKIIPGKFQLLLEQAVGTFDSLAEEKSPHRNKFLSFYIFAAGSYIFMGTIFELFGVQAVTERGSPISLPAPLADINGAIALGVMSYGVILIGGLVANGIGGALKALKDFSLPISMSFRLFGALLSGALVTELVYYYYSLSFVLPVIVGILFTLLHAIIQAYVLTMLTAQFYGESTENKKEE